MLVSMNGSKTHVQFFSNRLIKFHTRKSIRAWLALIVNVLFSSEPGNKQRHITIVALFCLAETVAFLPATLPFCNSQQPAAPNIIFVTTALIDFTISVVRRHRAKHHFCYHFTTTIFSNTTTTRGGVKLNLYQ
jgi:hypothetical protein